MEFNASNIKPFTLAILRQQVENQSNLCDFTITKGTWLKRFHRYVLVGAEFFHRLQDSTFQEKTKGSVEITVGGCPANLEAALMFLYDIDPRVTTENIAHLLELAEFLLIPTLKAHLFEWLTSETVSHGNFIQLLHLSSLYELDLPRCEDYIRANHNTCFVNSDFVSITKESVIALLSDDTLSYVGSDSKFKFILDWLRSRGPAWSDVGREFIQMIDMEEVSANIIAEAQNDPVFQRCKIPISSSWGQCPDRTVLLMNDSNTIACFQECKHEVYIFDANLFTLEVLRKRIRGDDRLCPTKSGFVIYNNTRVLDISRRDSMLVSSGHTVREILLEKAEGKSNPYNYTYLDNIWIRYLESDKNACTEWVSHDAFKSSSSIDKLTWTPITALHSQPNFGIFIRDAVTVTLPQSKLKCHAKCPHCEWLKNKTREDLISSIRSILLDEDDPDMYVFNGDIYSEYESSDDEYFSSDDDSFHWYD